MSEPLRFKPTHVAHDLVYSPSGDWVKWEDYACLKADYERLLLYCYQLEQDLEDKPKP